MTATLNRFSRIWCPGLDFLTCMSSQGIGFGLGVQVVGDPVAADRRVSKGAWGWAGAYGTNVHIEPAEDMVTIVLMQTSTPALQRDFENAVAQSIVK